MIIAVGVLKGHYVSWELWTNRNNSRYSGVADNFTLSLTFDGIFSFRNLQVFGINNLPKPYVPGNVVFQVLEVEHQINSGKWETIVTALVRCLGSSTVEYITVWYEILHLVLEIL